MIIESVQIQKIYVSLKDYLVCSELEFRQVWDFIHTHKDNQALRSTMNSVIQKIAFVEYLSSSQHNQYDVIIRSTQIFLLLSCLDSLANKRLPVSKRLQVLFEYFIPLGLVSAYNILMYENSSYFKKANYSQKKNIINQAQIYFNKRSLKDKSHIISDFYYNYYRNPYAHESLSALHDLPDSLMLIEFGTTKRDNIVWNLSQFSSLPHNIIGGYIKGDVVCHLTQLVRYVLSKKIESILLTL